MTPNRLKAENKQFAGSSGVSSQNRSLGLLPAFRDSASGKIYRSCWADGRPAAVHCLDGLPDDVVEQRSTTTGKVLAVRATLESGFVDIKENTFYTRAEACRLMAEG